MGSYFLLRYRERVKNFMGDVGFAEKIFGAGGTYSLIIVIGVLLFVVSLMYATGTLDGMLIKVFGGIF